MTQEEILKNYMGMSFEKQVELYNLFKQTLKDNNKKEELIKLDGQFRYFFELKNDLYENTRIFAGLNSTQVRYVRYNLYSELLEDLKYLNEDNYLSEENKIKRHKYVASQENTEKYYLPKSISNSIVDEFINYFNTLDRQHQIEIVSNFTKMFDNNRDYNDLSNISYTKDIIDNSRNMMYHLFGDLSIKYESLDDGIKFFIIYNIGKHIRYASEYSKEDEEIKTPQVRLVRKKAVEILDTYKEYV